MKSDGTSMKHLQKWRTKMLEWSLTDFYFFDVVCVSFVIRRYFHHRGTDYKFLGNHLLVHRLWCIYSLVGRIKRDDLGLFQKTWHHRYHVTESDTCRYHWCQQYTGRGTIIGSIVGSTIIWFSSYPKKKIQKPSSIYNLEFKIAPISISYSECS